EVTPHRVALRRRQPLGHLVGRGQHGPDDGAELLGGIGTDPALVEGVGRAGVLELLAHLPVDPVTGQECGHRLVKRGAVRDRQEIARVGEVRRRQGGRGDVGGRQPEVAEESFVERALYLEGAGGVLVEHDDPVVLGRSRAGERQRPGELAQVERVLDRVELEALSWERAVGEPAQERMPQDRSVDRLDRLPQLARECHQRPLKTGSRLSTKARAASRWSSVIPHRVWCHASRSRESLRVLLSAALKLRFMYWYAMRGPRPRRVASAIVSSSSRPSGTTRLTMPRASADGASTMSAV